MKAIGHAPNDGLCHCEHIKCHPNANCSKEAFYLVETFGIKQFLCAICFRYIRIQIERNAAHIGVGRNSNWRNK